MSTQKPSYLKSSVNSVRGLLRIGSIQQKLGLYAFILSLLAVSGVSFFSYWVARRQIHNDREQLMLVQARQTSGNLVDELNNMSEDLLLWRDIGYIRTSLKEHRNEPANAFFNEIVHQRTIYDFVFTIDINGRICAINSPGESLIGKPYRTLLGNAPASWFRDIVNSDGLYTIEYQRNPVVNALHGREAGSQPVEKLYQIGLAVAIRDRETKEALGVIAAIINWSHFQSVLDKVQKRFERLGLSTGYAFLTGNDKDALIGHRLREEYGKTATRDYGLFELHEKFKKDPNGTIKYTYKGNEKTVALAVVNPEPLRSQIAWGLGVGINNEEIFAPIQKLKLWFFVISLMIAVLAGAISLLFGRAVSLSLREFTQLARDASRGRFVKLAKARSYDELGGLAQAFNEMLVSFRAQMPFVKIPNPYVVGTPIRTPNMFFGRQEDLNWIGDRLERAGNIMILLYGDRRVGKTSLLHQINGERTSNRILPFFFDAQQLIPEIAHDSDFYHVLTRDMLSQIPHKLLGLKAPFIAADRFTPQTFRNLLEFLRATEPDKQPVLLFDEMENLEYKLARGDLSSDILLFLAGLLDSKLQISFVVTGSDRLEMKRLPDWNILIPKTISRKIGLLAYEDALRLIEEPVQGYFIYDDGIPDRILRITAGHPYYTQVICQTQIDFLNQNHEFAVGDEQLAQVVQMVLNNPPPPLSHVWDSFSKPQKIAATVTADALDNENDCVGVEELLNAMPAELNAHSGNRVSFLGAMESLVHEYWMEKSDQGTYRFRIDLLRLWIRREHTIWHLADELQHGTER